MSRDLRDKLKFKTIREIHPFANRGVLTIMGADERNRAIIRGSLFRLHVSRRDQLSG